MDLDYMTLRRVIDSAGEEMGLSVGGELGLITEMLESTNNFKNLRSFSLRWIIFLSVS